ncbi:ABC transporter substrate-binding protein [Hahella sp. CCB-MM4]|uniref:substrate-binding periplasmic protein n=1 Tax=Hahella sp. (strain CCB-MM4) TaxID=1926491 RepID=UPI000B9A744D|nr:transporter substrate-binding domain-containing protein [Hahella sp. CCB-MM4]
MKRVGSWILIVICLTFGKAAQAETTGLEAEKFVTVATLTNNPPFTFDKSFAEDLQHEIIPPGLDSERLQGYSWDILRESFHAMGYTIKLYIYPWVRAFEQVKAGKVDVLFPTGFNPERAEYFRYSEEPINHVDFLVYVNLDSSLQWEGLESLNGKTIGVLSGWNYGLKWKRQIEILKYDIREILQGFGMLDKGYIDGLAGYELSFDYALKQASWKNRYKKLPIFDSTDEFAVVSIQLPNGEQLLNDFDRGKQYINEMGIFHQINSKWHGVSESEISDL